MSLAQDGHDRDRAKLLELIAIGAQGSGEAINKMIQRLIDGDA